jgi:hypothetical protein
VNLQIAAGKKDAAADVGMIPAESLQCAEFGDCCRGRDEPSQIVLILLGENKSGTHGMLGWERPTGQDADGTGFLDAEQNTADLASATWQILAGFDFTADLKENCRGALDHEGTLRDTPNQYAGGRSRSRFFDTVAHEGRWPY